MTTASIVIVNRSQLVNTVPLLRACAAIKIQANRDFLPHWRDTIGIDQVDISLAETVPAGAWSVFIKDHSDDPGGLGYHLDDGIPSADVFVADCAQYGASLSVTLSHEILEMGADPLTTRTVTLGSALMAVEVGDPVEDDGFGYEIDGVLVSDFVLPSYFGIGAAGGPFDFRAQLTAGCPTLLPGGYQLVCRDGQWSQVTARLATGRMPYRAIKDGRKAFRVARAAA